MAKTIIKNCPECNTAFQYEIGKGKHRKYCFSKECYNARKIKQRLSRTLNYPKCSTPNCVGKATRVSYGLCETCYYRLRRNGTVNYKRKPPRYQYTTSGGYTKLYLPNHPLADSGGYVMEHRKVVHEHFTNNNEQLDCFWCGKSVSWQSMVVDHLNGDIKDNRICNLVMSCNGCNRTRGSATAFIQRLTPVGYKVFMKSIERQ